MLQFWVRVRVRNFISTRKDYQSKLLGFSFFKNKTPVENFISTRKDYQSKLLGFSFFKNKTPVENFISTRKDYQSKERGTHVLTLPLVLQLSDK